MTLLVPIMLFGWVPLTVLCFLLFRPHKAVLFSIIGGWLFLPIASYDLPGIPAYNKSTAISIGLILGSFLSRYYREDSFHWKVYDIPIILWCFFCPVATSLSNQLGWYDGVSNALNHTLTYGIPYFFGRIYFTNFKTMQDLCLGIIIGGMIYLPLCLFEIRMSPMLHREIYGFFQHHFSQHMRYGGFRPIVFMHQGLMVALWMALSTTVTFWYWRFNERKHLKGIPLSLIFISLFVTTVLCKSANGWVVLFLGVGSYMLYINLSTVLPFKVLLIAIPVYIIARVSGLLSSHEIFSMATFFFDEDRILSLTTRLSQESIICAEVLKRPFLGWGGYDRGIPVDIYTGRSLVRARDSLWLISFNTYGFIGLFSIYASLLFGPWLILSNSKKVIKNNTNYFFSLAIVLSLIVIFFSIDSLFNGMFFPIYIVISGALVSLGPVFCYNSYNINIIDHSL